MRCFYHGAEDAVAICTSCGKALCRPCISESEPECACSDECAGYSRTRRRDLALQSKRHHSLAVAGEFGCYLSGALFVIVGVFLGVRDDPVMLYWAVPLGLVMMAAGLFYSRSRRMGTES